MEKGETLKDTLLTLDAYGPDVVVIRHAQVGAAALATRYTRAAVVNAGDGAHQHPTQSLLDLYTMRAALGRVEGVHVAIVGDVLHSRVARSNLALLLACGAARHADRPALADPARHRGDRRRRSRTTSRDIAAADVVYVLRMQRERMLPGEAYVPSLREYTLRYGVTAERLRPGQVVMHPGPMNRGVEITRRGRRLGGLAGHRARCAPAWSCAWPCSTTCSPGRARRRRERTRARAARSRRRAARADLLVRGARVLDPGEGIDARARRARARRRHRRARRRRSTRRPASRSIEADGCTLLPAFIDPHVHLRTPGQEHKEDLATGTAAAAAGGYCSVLAMPNTDPVVDSPQVLDSLHERAAVDARVRVGFLAAISLGQHGEQLAPLGELADHGACGYSDDGRPVLSAVAPAARAAVRGDDRARALAALRGHVALARGRHARGRGLRAARPGRLPGHRRVDDDRAATCASPSYESRPLHICHLHVAAVGRGGAPRARLGRRRLGRGLAAPPAADRRGGARRSTRRASR